MNKNRGFIGVVAAGVMVLMTNLGVMHAAAEDVAQTARVTSINGKARYSTGQKTWSDLKKGQVLKPGSLIQTAAKAMVDIDLGGSGNAVRLFDDSVLSIDKLDSDKSGAEEVANTQLDLRIGQIAGTVKKLSPNSKYEIKFQSGVAGVREGVYQISSAGALSMREGSAVIANQPPGGTMTTKAVSAGQHFDSKTGNVTSISQAEAEQSSRNGHEPKAMPKPVTPSTPPVRPGI